MAEDAQAVGEGACDELLKLNVRLGWQWRERSQVQQVGVQHLPLLLKDFLAWGHIRNLRGIGADLARQPLRLSHSRRTGILLGLPGLWLLLKKARIQRLRECRSLNSKKEASNKDKSRQNDPVQCKQ